jgi:hypothetical protein
MGGVGGMRGKWVLLTTSFLGRQVPRDGRQKYFPGLLPGGGQALAQHRPV